MGQGGTIKCFGTMAIAVLALAAGCAPQRPPHLDNPRAHKHFPPSEYLCYTASSAESMADAETRAKKGVAEQVHSEISAVSSSFQRETRQGDKAVYRSDDKVLVEVSSSFTHAEMIEIDPDSGGRYQGRHFAFACLSKRAFSARASDEYKQNAIPFRKAVARAGNAAGLGEFSTAYATAKSRIEAMRVRAMEIRAVTGRPLRAFDQDLKRWEELLSRRSDRLQKSRISVEVETGERPEDASALEAKLCGALAALGITAGSGGECEKGLRLRLRASHACKAGAFGPACTLTLDADVRACGSEKILLRAELSEGLFRGSSTQSETKALRAAWDSITADALKDRLKKCLSAVLPL